MATVDNAISRSQEKCKALGVTYDQVWQQWSEENKSQLSRLAKKADFWWTPGIPGGVIMASPTVVAVWFTLLDGVGMCGLSAWFTSSVVLSAVVLPVQRWERITNYKDAIGKRMILDRIAECRRAQTKT